MKSVFILACLLLCLVGYSQEKDTIQLYQNEKIAAIAQYNCLLGDTNLMQLHPNGKIYKFKDKLSDGLYCAFVDKNFNDTAMLVVVENGKYNGLLKRWHNGELEEECEYKDGLKNGWRKLYLHTKEYGVLLDIEKCINDACVEIYTEW